MAARFIIVVRQSPNWSLGFDPSEFERLTRRPPGSVADLVRLWDETFRVSFSEIRQHMKDIARDSLLAVGVRILDFAAYLDHSPQPSAFYLFTDDDDWFAPNIIERLRGQERQQLMIWGSVRFRGSFEFREIEKFCYTNNYAVRGRLIPEKARRLKLLGHGSASKLASRHRVTIVPEYLSVTNKHPASVNMMSEALKGDGLVKSVRRYLRQGPVPQECAWASTYAARAAEVFGALV